jgi:hypothetical protein
MQTAQLESSLFLRMESPNRAVQRESREEFWQSLECSVCGWEGNRNRCHPPDERLLIPYVRQFVIRDLKHLMHHAFPGRFPVSHLTPKWVRQQIEAERAFNKELDRRIGPWEKT